MAIKIVTGKPGSGKSYYALYKVILEGFSFNKKTFEWSAKSDQITIITNIEGLKLPHYSLQKIVDDFADGNLEKFFTVDIQQKLTDTYPKIRYVIDECQRWFHSKFYNKDTFFYFQYHRHFGHDIYMIAQVWDSISKHITGLCEYEFRASPRSFTLMGEFTYHIYAGFDRVGAVRLPSDKKIFALYQSFQQSDTGKEIRPVRKYAFIAVGLVGLAVLGCFWFLNSFHLAGGGERPAASAPPPAALPPSSRPVPAPVADRPSAAPAAKPSEQQKPSETYILQYTGGFIVGDKVTAIQWAGKLLPVEGFPYQWSYLGKGQIQVFVPESAINLHLAQN